MARSPSHVRRGVAQQRGDGRLTHPSGSGEESERSYCSRAVRDSASDAAVNKPLLEARLQPGGGAAAEPTGIMSNKAVI